MRTAKANSLSVQTFMANKSLSDSDSENKSLSDSDSEAYAIGKKEKPPFVARAKSSSEEDEDPIPDELLCLLCKDLMTDAVVIPCCGNSYCDDCESERTRTNTVCARTQPR